MRRLGEINKSIMEEELFINEKDSKLGRKNRITIGRDVGNDIIVDYPNVDCYHCCIELLEEDKFWITDMHSANGTFVYGKKVEDSMGMRSFDTVEVGSHKVDCLHHFSDVSLQIPCGGLCRIPDEESQTTQDEEKHIAVDEDTMKKRRAELSKRLKNGETIAFGKGGKIVDVDSDEAIGNIPPGKFSAMDSNDEMRRKREELRKRLIKDEHIPPHILADYVQCEEERKLTKTEEFIISQVSIINECYISDKEMCLTDPEKLDLSPGGVCAYICSLIDVILYFRRVYYYDLLKEMNNNTKEPEMVDDFVSLEQGLFLLNRLFSTFSWGEMIKLKIGDVTINTMDIGRYLVLEKSPIVIEGTDGDFYTVLLAIRNYLRGIRNRHDLLYIPVVRGQGWGVGYL